MGVGGGRGGHPLSGLTVSIFYAYPYTQCANYDEVQIQEYYDGTNAHQIVSFTLSWGEKRKGIRAIGKRCQSWVGAISTLLQFLDTLFLIALHPPPTDTLQPERTLKIIQSHCLPI